MTGTVVSRDGHDISGPTSARPTNAEPGMTFYDTTVEQLYAANSTGGMRSVSGHVGVLTVAATGTNQGTAAALSGGSLNNVTGADGTKGVILPTITIGDTIKVYNSSTLILKVYPTGTNTIAAGSASASVNVQPNITAEFTGVTATNWATDVAEFDLGAITVDSIAGGSATLPITGLAAAQGGSATLIGGTSSTAGNAGGVAGLTGGTPGITGVGGAIAIVSGPGGATSGQAGAVTIAVGAATSGAGSAVTITGGAGAGGTSAGGNVNLVGGTAVSTGAPGEVQVNGDSNLMFVTEALTATDATRTVMIATRVLRLKSAKVVWTTGSSSGTLQLEKCTGTTAPGSGTVLLSGTMTLAGTGNTVVSGSVLTTVASITFAAGDRLGIVIAGTMTNLVGCRVTFGLNPC